MTIRAIVFDVDGTLAETEDLHRRAFNRAFAQLGLPWHWEPTLYADLLTVMGGKERLAHYIDTQHPADAKALHARAPEIHARKTAAYGALVVESRLPLRPGIARLIAMLSGDDARRLHFLDRLDAYRWAASVAPWEMGDDDWPEARASLLCDAERLGVRDKVEPVLK